MGSALRRHEARSSAARGTMPTRGGKKSGGKGRATVQPQQPPAALARTLRASQAKTLLEQMPPAPDPDQRAYAYLRRTLYQDFDMFILNNLLLTVRFYENFESEIKQLRLTYLSEDESHCNRQLYQHQRHCLWPDKLQEQVAKHVAFRKKHGTNKGNTEALSTRRIIVVQDNIEVVGETGAYKTYKSHNSYQLRVESAKRQGYVKLRSTRSPDKRRTTYETIESRKSGDDLTDTENSDSVLGKDCRFSTLEENEPSTNATTLFHEPIDSQNDIEISEITKSLSPGAEALYDLQKQIENRSVQKNKTAADLQSPPIISVSPTPTSTKVLGPQNPEKEHSLQTEYTPTQRRLSGTGKTLLNSLSKMKIQLKPASSLNDLDQIKKHTDPNRLSPPQSESSGYRSASPTYSYPNSQGSESDYGYATITELKTPRPVHTRRLGNLPSESSIIPSECFQRFEVPTIHTGTYDDSDDSDSDEIYSKSHSNRKLFELQYYLKSSSYMASFVDVFIEKISLTLGFTEESVEVATTQGDKIYCDIVQQLIDNTSMKVRMDITPSIHCKSWPSQALEWKFRQRDCILDRSTNFKYTWPTKEMIEAVQKYGYHLFPLGYSPTHGANENYSIEWTIGFPEAERYLELHLTHPPIFSFLFTLALHKNFLDPLIDSELKLLPSHIRTILFWECEKDYAVWQEDRLGESLMRLLKAIYVCLKKRNLPDYFIKGNNKFESIPNRDLSKVQQKLHSIIENPVKYALIAVRDLQYICKENEDTFYPKIDYKKLDDIISTENYASLLNPKLATITSANKTDGKQDSSDEEKHEKEAYDRKRQWQRDARRHYEAKKAAHKFTTAPKASVESINIKVQPQKNDPMRSKLLLELFIPHFIEMAKYSNKYSAKKQAIFYLEHAERLTKLLAEQSVSERSKIELFKSKINFEQVAINAARIHMPTASTSIPETSHHGTGNKLGKHHKHSLFNDDESSTDRAPEFPRRDSNQDAITIVDVHNKPKLIMPIEVDVEESIDL